MMFNKCSNCEGSNKEGAILLVQGLAVLATLCIDCQLGVKVLKIVLRKEDKDGPFEFEQYLPVEMHK